MRKAGIFDKLQRIGAGAADAFGEGREDHRIAYKRGRELADKQLEGTRISTTLGTNRSLTAARELLGLSNPEHQKALRSMGMNLSDDGYTRTGQLLGIAAADLTQDVSRSFWWLVNAPQAVANIANEAIVHKANPELIDKLKPVILEKGDRAGEVMKYSNKGADYDEGVARGIIDKETGLLRKQYQIDERGKDKFIYRA